MRHWGNMTLMSAWRRWRDAVQQHNALLGTLRSVAVRLQQPLKEDAWQAWQGCIGQQRDVKVCFAAC